MFLALVSVNGAPAVPYPADSLSQALGALSVAVHYLVPCDEVTRLAACRGEVGDGPDDDYAIYLSEWTG